MRGAIDATPPGLGIVEGNAIPYQPAAAEKKKENAKNRASLDPERVFRGLNDPDVLKEIDELIALTLTDASGPERLFRQVDGIALQRLIF